MVTLDLKKCLTDGVRPKEGGSVYRDENLRDESSFVTVLPEVNVVDVSFNYVENF